MATWTRLDDLKKTWRLEQDLATRTRLGNMNKTWQLNQDLEIWTRLGKLQNLGDLYRTRWLNTWWLQQDLVTWTRLGDLNRTWWLQQDLITWTRFSDLNKTWRLEQDIDTRTRLGNSKMTWRLGKDWHLNTKSRLEQDWFFCSWWNLKDLMKIKFICVLYIIYRFFSKIGGFCDSIRTRQYWGNCKKYSKCHQIQINLASGSKLIQNQSNFIMNLHSSSLVSWHWREPRPIHCSNHSCPSPLPLMSTSLTCALELSIPIPRPETRRASARRRTLANFISRIRCHGIAVPLQKETEIWKSDKKNMLSCPFHLLRLSFPLVQRVLQMQIRTRYLAAEVDPSATVEWLCEFDDHATCRWRQESSRLAGNYITRSMQTFATREQRKLFPSRSIMAGCCTFIRFHAE